MKTGIVILSRYSSSRLPGKALMQIENKPVLQYIIERALQVFDKEQIVIATSDLDSDQPICDFAAQQGIACYRGSLENVSERFYLAARSQGWDYGIRINGDNIFLDTQVLKEMLDILNSKPVSFVSNVKNRTFPKGMSIEMVSLDYYREVLPEIVASDHYREHVTLYLYENDTNQDFYYFYNTILPEVSGIQMALDTQEDFDRSCAIISHFEKPQWEYNMVEINHILKKIKHEQSI
ncbi:MAG: cytidylyltransferase domain-containing protein [Bacteroidota bacterium]